MHTRGTRNLASSFQISRASIISCIDRRVRVWVVDQGLPAASEINNLYLSAMN